MARPSPRTQGVQIGTDPETGEPTQYTFQKFGTQQLQFVTPPKLGTPYQGVQQRDTGYNFKGLTTSGYTGTKTTAFSQQFQAGITGVQKTVPRDVAIMMQEEKLDEMGLPDLKLPDLGDLFGEGAIDKNGCECEACKDGTGQCSDKVPICDAWDIGCELTGGKVEETFNWIKIILVLIGIGILLYLLRPLFGLAKNLTEK
mgnify:FL=1|jgi:hypothetical protein|tara:strand:+ start:129 stop:728 length:600 start_codon:yes stop_codon:yes gene_type:complete